jgi:hypothetical protein
MMIMNKYYLPRADKTYLTPNEKWYRIQGILIGINIGMALVVIGLLLLNF